MSPGSLDHLLLLYLEGNQVHRKGKRHICKQLAACRGEDELTGDPEGAREFVSQRPALKLGGKRSLDRECTQEPRARLPVHHLLAAQVRAIHFRLLSRSLLICEITELYPVFLLS